MDETNMQNSYCILVVKTIRGVIATTSETPIGKGVMSLGEDHYARAEGSLVKTICYYRRVKKIKVETNIQSNSCILMAGTIVVDIVSKSSTAIEKDVFIG